ncbi:MAG TPA: DUF362 domain-containing protein [Myxococcota bacterium]|nr:DUF362 domain-containing protein [Myxococcota bacterium]
MKRNDGPPKIDRRKFLLGAATLALGAKTGLVGCSGSSSGPTDAGPDAQDGADGGALDGADQTPDGDQESTGVRVVDVHDENSLSGGSLVSDVVTAMLHKGLEALAGEDDQAAALRALLPNFDAGWKIGIKVNCRNSRYLPNSTELVGALVDTLVDDLGAVRENLVIWDSRGSDLTASGMTASVLGGGVTVKGADAGSGYDTLSVGNSSVKLSRILTRETDFTLDVSLLKHHYGAGVTGSLKNVSFGAIESPMNFHNSHNPDDPNALQRSYIPAIFNLEEVRTRVLPLYIIEGFYAIRDRGPDVAVTDLVGRLLLSTDPVAIDQHALVRINELRINAGLSEVSSSLTSWMEEAVTLRLGTTNYELVSIEM